MNGKQARRFREIAKKQDDRNEYVERSTYSNKSLIMRMGWHYIYKRIKSAWKNRKKDSHSPYLYT